MKYTKLKGLLDVLFAFVLLIIISPVLIVLSLLNLIFMGSPILFSQKRPGRKKRIFKLYKFRTMINKEYKNGKKLTDRERLTTLGFIMRRFSIDELPQLINICKGEMSFIGPRPLLERYIPYYSERENLRFEVNPGISGLAQVRGRNNLSWDKRLEYDSCYVEKLSFKLDLKIFWETLVKIIKKENVAIDPNEVMDDLDVERDKKVQTSR